ncbi:MAG: biotin/lipoyl-binding protein [Rikenellaceae bacterium]|nr:biotin/lipoyl-binding protein [Rikenellaceae bacterium]MCL2693337.1 biotin/lipoyl-binding protein [Rikenellaceae bacterium]
MKEKKEGDDATRKRGLVAEIKEKAARVRKARKERERAASEKKVKAEEKKAREMEKKNRAAEKERAEKAEKARREEIKNREFHMICTESGCYETTLNKMFLSRRPWQPDEGGRILSFMPGTVEEIAVKAGDTVKAGDVLMIFRAMKMNNRILAPADGVVGSVHVQPGENVSKNTVMIEFV